jgi:DNA-binding transcriptional regulator YbjK
VVLRDGVAGVTHRTVAREAGVPTTATTYYFATLDDLLTAALLWSADQVAAEVRQVVAAVAAGADPTTEVTALLARAAGPLRGRTAAEYELYLLAARRPELRPAARRWLDALAEVVPHPDPVAFRALLAGVDGLLVQALIADRPPTEAELRPVVAHLLTAAGLRAP